MQLSKTTTDTPGSHAPKSTRLYEARMLLAARLVSVAHAIGVDAVGDRLTRQLTMTPRSTIDLPAVDL